MLRGREIVILPPFYWQGKVGMILLRLQGHRAELGREPLANMIQSYAACFLQSKDIEAEKSFPSL